VNACATVNVRRIFVSEEKNFHAPRVEQASGLLSTELASETLALPTFALSAAAPAPLLRGVLYRLSPRKVCR
jgi:hypothetical protein